MDVIFALSNVVILVGYYVLAGALTRLLTRFIAINRPTQIGMLGFFVTCSLTHLHMAYHAIVHPDQAFSDHFFEPLSVANHLAQAGFVWLFVLGMARALDTEQMSLDPAEQTRKIANDRPEGDDAS